MESNGNPIHNPNTFKTNVPGNYIAGEITGGTDGSRVFIENSRNHGKKL
ncbi:MAG: hypothetical protein ACE5JB_12895 [bacterium]